MNIINAIIHLVNNPITELVQHYQNRNRANSAGDALEEYIKDLFANSFSLPENDRIKRHSEVFSYLGNNSNPPDAMLKNGDAIEVKKIENPHSALALNSSYPKAKLFANSPMISRSCREAEEWTEKDLIYVVGVVDENKLNHLAMVYGEDYCASEECYLRPVDPLGITKIKYATLEVKNPFQVFNDIYEENHSNEFNFMAIINDEKWEKLDNRYLLTENNQIKIQNIQIKSPNNPLKLKSAKLITYSH